MDDQTSEPYLDMIKKTAYLAKSADFAGKLMT